MAPSGTQRAQQAPPKQIKDTFSSTSWPGVGGFKGQQLVPGHTYLPGSPVATPTLQVHGDTRQMKLGFRSSSGPFSGSKCKKPPQASKRPTRKWPKNAVLDAFMVPTGGYINDSGTKFEPQLGQEWAGPKDAHVAPNGFQMAPKPVHGGTDFEENPSRHAQGFPHFERKTQRSIWTILSLLIAAQNQ